MSPVCHGFITNVYTTKQPHELKGNDAINNFDLNGVIGISYEFKNFVFELRENICTSNLMKNDHRDYKDATKMGNVSLSFGYRF